MKTKTFYSSHNGEYNCLTMQKNCFQDSNCNRMKFFKLKKSCFTKNVQIYGIYSNIDDSCDIQRNFFIVLIPIFVHSI